MDPGGHAIAKELEMALNLNARTLLLPFGMLSLLCLAVLSADSLAAQAAEDPAQAEEIASAGEAPEAGEELLPERGSLIPSFPGEQLDESAAPLDPKEVVGRAAERMGGADHFKNVQDLKLFSEHRNYNSADRLFFVEYATMYFKPGTFFKARLDFENYAKPADLQTFFDYREVLGEDGAFKVMEGKLLRTPVAVREAGERITHTLLQVFGLFFMSPDEEHLRYIGRVSWPESDEKDAGTITCHKILILHDDPRLSVRGDALSIYIDTENHAFRRYVYEPLMKGAKSVHRIRIADFVEFEEAGGLKWPSYIYSVDYWNGKINSTHDYRFKDFKINTGLEGIGFEMFDQLRDSMKAEDGAFEPE